MVFSKGVESSSLSSPFSSFSLSSIVSSTFFVLEVVAAGAAAVVVSLAAPETAGVTADYT